MLRQCKIVMLAFSFVFVSQTFLHAGFVGELLLAPIKNDTKNKKLLKPFAFIDNNGLGWEAAKGDITDGASIPFWAKPFIGNNFDPMFIKAAVLHDHYCKKEVRDWKSTHRMFYEALKTQGVSELKAKLMYYAVYVGAHKWHVHAGKNCSLLPNTICIQTVPDKANTDKLQSQPAQYSKIKDFHSELMEINTLIHKDDIYKQPNDLSAIEKLALQRHPENKFFMMPAVIDISAGSLPTK